MHWQSEASQNDAILKNWSESSSHSGKFEFSGRFPKWCKEHLNQSPHKLEAIVRRFSSETKL